MADYPEWVMKHKKKGTYVNRVGDKYYLYAAHSERVKGTKKVLRISDGYLGRITEKDGFIPAKRKLSSEVLVYEYGLSWVITSLCKRVHSGLRREFKGNADYVMAAGVLLFMYGEVRQEFYETSYLSLFFSGLDMGKEPTDRQRTGVERTQRMVADTLKKHFEGDCTEALALLPLVRMVCMAGDSRVAAMAPAVVAFCEKHGIHFEEGYRNGQE
jgi:hypothetical protein